METLLVPALNLGALVAGLFFVLRKPATQFVQARHATIADQVKSNQEQLEKAHQQLQDITARLKNVQSEIDTIRDSVVRDAQQIRTRIVEEAKKSAVAIVADARQAQQGFGLGLKKELIEELAMRVIDRAEKKLAEKVTGAEQARMKAGFLDQLEGGE